MNVDPRDFIWAQKWRPRKVEDCILPTATKAMLQGMIANNEITHLLFVGGPGMGKTTAALAIASELGSDVMILNAAMESGIDVLRTKIQGFASTISLSDSGPKIVILDEADGIKHDMQNGLKAFLEAFSANCRFILTANNKHKIIEPLHSRCTVVDFRIEPSEKPKLAAAFYKRVISILTEENVVFDTKVVAKIVEKNFPDFRKTLNELQRFAAAGQISAECLQNHSADSYKELIGYLKEKDFTNARKWVGKNEDINASTLFRSIYDIAVEQMKPKDLPGLILILADYGFKSTSVIDQQINNMACLVEIMSSCSWE